MASLALLPDEVILQIFSYLLPEDLLFGIKGTCRYFRDLCSEPSLWNHVTITNISPETRIFIDDHQSGERPASNFVSCEFYKKLLRQRCVRRGGGGEAEGGGGEAEEGGGPEKEVQTGKILGTVPVKNMVTSLEERGEVWATCAATQGVFYPHLQRLTLVSEFLPPMQFLARYSALQVLDLKFRSCLLQLPSPYGENEIGRFAIILFENLKSLTSLQILKFFCLAAAPLTHENAAVSKSMVKYFSTGPRLRQIDLNCFVNDEIFKAILNHCLQLETLALAHAEPAPKASFTAVSKDPRQLVSLKVEDCSNLNDDFLKCVALIFPNLKSLHLSLTSKMTDCSVGLLLGALSQLTCLKLTSSGGYRNTADCTEIVFGDCLEKLHHGVDLQCLVLENFYLSFLPDPVFNNLCRRQQNLRTIELKKSDVTDSDMLTLTDNCRLLQNVTVRFSDVTTAGVTTLMTNLTHLRTLTCEMHHLLQFEMEKLQPLGSRRTEPGGLVWLDQPRSWLHSLDLGPCQEFTFAGVQALASLCPYIRRLHLQAISNVNDHIVREVLRCFPQLQDLKLAATSRDREKNKLTARCLSHINQWGHSLQKVQLITFYRAFTLEELANHIARSGSSLLRWSVPMRREGDRSSCHEALSDLKVKVELMTAGKKTVVARPVERCIWRYPVWVLCVQVCHWPKTP